MCTKLAAVDTVKNQACDSRTIYAKRLSADEGHFDIVLTCVFLARRNIPIRGHRDEEMGNKGHMLKSHKLLLNQNDYLCNNYENFEFKMHKIVCYRLLLMQGLR